MNWIERSLRNVIQETVETRPALMLTGARQTGKSSLLRKTYSEANYVTLDNVTQAQFAEENPEAFLSKCSEQTILDEIQYAPSLFRYLKILIDSERSKYGRWIITGSQRFNLMQDLSESLAGRAGILHLETLSAHEIRHSDYFSKGELEDYLWKGGYPELWSTPSVNQVLFFESYLQTYLERDLRQIINVKNLRDFQRCVLACATRVGSLLNYSDIGSDIGLSVPTIKNWISALEASGLIYLLPGYYRNVGQRLIKAPKLYFADHGLLCHLLGIRDFDDWLRHPRKGAIWENVVFSELVKNRLATVGKELFYYRDKNGLEMDFLIDNGNSVELIEAKASEQPDQQKVNFKKIETLFDLKVNNTIMCRVPEEGDIRLKSMRLVNPLLTDIEII